MKKNLEQVNRYTKYFANIGITFNKVFYIDNRKNKEESKDYIINSDIIFLMGCSPKLQMQFINNYELSDLIRTRKIFVGVSAGAMNQGSRVVYKDEFENNIMQDYLGLNLTDINIYPHYDLDNQECIDEVNEIINIHPIICLPNESFVYIENSNKKIIGKYYKIN